MKGYSHYYMSLPRQPRPRHAFERSRWFYARVLEADSKAVGRPVTVLDYGCGPLGSLRGLAPCVEVTRYDHDPTCDAEHSLDGLGVFDWVVMMDVIEHMPLAEALAALDWADGHASRGVIVGTPNAFHYPWVYFEWDWTHVMPYNVAGLTWWFTERDYDVEVWKLDWLSRNLLNPFKVLYTIALGKSFFASHGVIARRR